MEERDLFREYTDRKPMEAKELHELMKYAPLYENKKVIGYRTASSKLVKQVESGLYSMRHYLRHFSLAALQTKRPDIFEKLSEDIKLKDRTRNKVLNEEGTKYVRQES